jgi:hypothetical protein
MPSSNTLSISPLRAPETRADHDVLEPSIASDDHAPVCINKHQRTPSRHTTLMRSDLECWDSSIQGCHTPTKLLDAAGWQLLRTAMLTTTDAALGCLQSWQPL